MARGSLCRECADTLFFDYYNVIHLSPGGGVGERGFGIKVRSTRCIILVSFTTNSGGILADGINTTFIKKNRAMKEGQSSVLEDTITKYNYIPIDEMRQARRARALKIL